MEKELEKNLEQELGAELETVEAPKKPSFLRRLRNHRGFSLVEMAIVLIIIGIIIAAIVKGQDLMVNARAKQLVSTANGWKVATFAYMDRNGRFPGDPGKDGLIGSTGGIGVAGIEEQTTATTAIYELDATLPQTPANPVMIGGQSFWIYLGRITATVGARNVMTICKDVDCATALSPDDVEIFKALDTAFDGEQDALKGQVRAITTAGAATTIAALGAGANGRQTGVVVAPVVSNVTPSGAAGPTPWSSAVFGAVWAFDKPF